MSHFFTFFTNENGIVSDDQFNIEISKAISPSFGFNDVFLYSHGWWTDANDASNDYNRFSIGFANQLLTDKLANGSQLGQVPISSLCTGVHWPSTVSEDSGLAQLLDVTSFFTMESRADDIGETGVHGLLLSILRQWKVQRSGKLTINLLGHSFGTKVVCSALESLCKSAASDTTLLSSVHFNVVLLQAAFDNNDFEADQLYSSVVAGIPGIRMLITRSDLDLALKLAYPAAHCLEFFKKTNRVAMGYAGPTSQTEALFGGAPSKFPVTAGQRFATTPPFPGRLVVADLTQLHTANNAAQRQANPNWNPPAGGNHSDIYCDEIYSLIARFLY